MKNEEKYSKFCIKEKECDANWQVINQGGVAYVIQCRICKVVLSNGGTPKCLKSTETSEARVKELEKLILIQEERHTDNIHSNSAVIESQRNKLIEQDSRIKELEKTIESYNFRSDSIGYIKGQEEKIKELEAELVTYRSLVDDATNQIEDLKKQVKKAYFDGYNDAKGDIKEGVLNGDI